MFVIILFWVILIAATSVWFFRRAAALGKPKAWQYGFAGAGAALNIVLFIVLNGFVDDHMPRWFYRLIIKNELLGIGLVMFGVTILACLCAFVLIRRTNKEN